MSKPRVVKDYERLPVEIQEQIKLNYPYGYTKHLIQYKNAEGKFVSALPFEAEDRYYLIRMTPVEARQIISDDEDYDDAGMLKDDVKEEYEEKYSEISGDDEDEDIDVAGVSEDNDSDTDDF